MESRSVFSELLDIYTNPSGYVINDWREDGVAIPLSGWRVAQRRSNDCIEFTISEEEGSRLVVTIPMTLSVLEHSRQMALRIEQCDTMLYGEYEVRSVSFVSRQNPSRITIGDVVVQRVDGGAQLLSSYVEMLSTDDIDSLYVALRRMESELVASNGYFKEISMADVVVVDDELLYPVRLSELRFAYGRGGYPESGSGCEVLRSAICEVSGVEDRSTKCVASNSRYPRRKRRFVEGYLWSGELHEDRIAVRSDVGMGFVDGSHKVVVPLIYNVVEAFDEGRAVVECDRGVGLIDLWGREVIPAQYEELDYNSDTGITAVLLDGKWSYISYNGELIADEDTF